MNLRRVSSTFLLGMCFFYAHGQPGLDEIGEADSTIRGWFPAMSNFALVLAAIFGILAGVRIYTDWQNGEREPSRSVTRWVLAAFFMASVSGAMRLLFF